MQNNERQHSRFTDEIHQNESKECELQIIVNTASDYVHSLAMVWGSVSKDDRFYVFNLFRMEFILKALN